MPRISLENWTSWWKGLTILNQLHSHCWQQGASVAGQLHLGGSIGPNALRAQHYDQLV
jgi:hypothetical protein